MEVGPLHHPGGLKEDVLQPLDRASEGFEREVEEGIEGCVKLGFDKSVKVVISKGRALI